MDIIIFVAPAIFILGIGAYAFLAIFYPEWVGITGQVAQKNLDEHKEGSAAEKDSDLLS